MTTTEILTGIKDWVLSKLSLKQDVINDLAAIRSGSQAGSTAVQPSDLSSYFNDASYDTSTHRINFYHGQDVVAYVDASPFIVDGMVDDVRIENGYLVIDFNTDSGKQDISIPLTDIFDPSNYYNKTQTDALLGNKVDKVSGKGLSTNDYTNAEKEKLSGLQNYDDTQVRQLIGQKQDIIQDLEDIRSGASAGASAVQPSTLNSALSDTVAESGVYDVTANNNNAKFASLSALLGSENLDTLIPSAKRKGGMSIKFAQSSDNKYVQYRLMADEFTIDTTQWAICDIGVYIENPEFVRVYTDSEDKILLAIKADGDIYFGAGVPTQIKNYILSKITELELDKVEDIVTFLGNLIEGDSLSTLLNAKVNKVIGKSLIDTDFATGISYIENQEFVIACIDSENRILFGIKSDGSTYFGYGVPQQIVDYVQSKIGDYSPNEYKKIVDFLDGKEDGSDTLTELLDKKVDKDEVINSNSLWTTVERNNIGSRFDFSRVGVYDYYAAYHELAFMYNRDFTENEPIGYSTEATYERATRDSNIYPIQHYTYRRHDANPTKRIVLIAGQHTDGLQFNLVTDEHWYNDYGDSPQNILCTYFLIHDLLANPDKNELFSFISNNFIIEVVPIVNPWGCQNHSGLNGRGVNLNRNWDYHWADITAASEGVTYPGADTDYHYAGITAFSENETLAVKNLLQTYNDVVFFVDVHARGNLTLPVNSQFYFIANDITMKNKCLAALQGFVDKYNFDIYSNVNDSCTAKAYVGNVLNIPAITAEFAQTVWEDAYTRNGKVVNYLETEYFEELLFNYLHQNENN